MNLDDVFENELLLFLEIFVAVTFIITNALPSLLIFEVFVNADFVEGLVLRAVEVLERLDLRDFLPIELTWVI